MRKCRADLGAGRVDLADVIDLEAQPVGPIHPGYILHVDFMELLGLSVGRFHGVMNFPLDAVWRHSGKCSTWVSAVRPK